mgnify:CR=1 FL=1
MTQTDDSLPPGAAPSRRRRTGWRWLVIGLLLVLAMLAASVLSLAPVVPLPRAPDAPTATAARDVLQQITGDDTQRGDLVRFTLAQRELDGLAVLASEALSPLRVQARVRSVPPAQLKASSKSVRSIPPAGELVIDMSRELGWGMWINATAQVRPTEPQRGTGLPDIAVTLGRLPVPQWVTHWALERVWAQTQSDATRPISLEQALKSFAIAPPQARLALVNPGRGTALWGLTRAGAATPDPRMLSDAYCAIADTGKANLAVLVRRAAALKIPSGVTPQEHNRVLLTAIAMRAVPEFRIKLAGAAWKVAASCDASPERLTLAGREDLSAHWALSAALAATVGSQVAQSMGTWKELADSIEGGSGFSFVDLSADRSGERFAVAAVNPQLARAVHARLVAITEDQMLPKEALARPEGLDQAAFERNYTAVNSPEYTRALRTIDRLLDNVGVP